MGKKIEEQNKTESAPRKIPERRQTWLQSILEESKDLVVFIFSETLGVLTIMASLWFTEKVVLEFLFAHEAPPVIKLVIYISAIAITIAYVVGVIASLYQYIRIKTLARNELKKAIVYHQLLGRDSVVSQKDDDLKSERILEVGRKVHRAEKPFASRTSALILNFRHFFDKFNETTPWELTDFRTRALANAVIKRAQRILTILKGANILWIDDHPKQNTSEIKVLEAFGIFVQKARSSSEALIELENNDFDVIISDIDRADNDMNGIQFFNEVVRPRDLGKKTIFFIFSLDSNKGSPPGSAGITNRPTDLLHLVMDVIERHRS